MGLSESNLSTITKPFPFLSHCKVPCDSPCCVKICGEDNHSIFHTDTHENVISDSDEEHIGQTINTAYLRNVPQVCHIVFLPRWCKWGCRWWCRWELPEWFFVI